MSKLKRNDYEELLVPLQEELAALARWLQHTGKRALVLFEGRDTAGKGTAIDAIREHINVFVNKEYGQESTAVSPADQLQVIPAISGG